MSKTIIAVRPGFQQSAIAAFGTDFEIEVDQNLDKDYEFRERDLGLADLLEAEIAQDEREGAKKADPKNAQTYVVPLLGPDETVDDGPQHLTFLTIRVDKNAEGVNDVLAAVAPVTEHDDAINVRATINSLYSELKKADIKVHSISSSRGMTFLKPLV